MLKKLGSLLILLLLVTPGCGRKKAVTTLTPAIPVKTTAVARGVISEVYKTTGIVEANQEAKVSAKIAGRISQVRVKLGDFVRANRVLIELEPDDLQNENHQAQASLSQAQAKLKQSRDNFHRLQQLYQQQAISRQEFEQAQTELDIDTNQVKQAQATLALNENQIKNTRIIAPFNGYIGEVEVTQGEVVNPGVPLLTIADLSQVLVTINLSDSYIGRIRRGQTAQIGLSAYPGAVFSGKIIRIAPIANENTKTFPVKIVLANPGQKIKSGMLAEVRFNFNERKDVLKIPINAVVDEIGAKSVFVVAKGRAIRKSVTLGISDGKMVEIVSGLTGTERVVILGQNNLDDGLKVTVKQ
jgi:RND family efflux transporter MFP subunit